MYPPVSTEENLTEDPGEFTGHENQES